MERIIDGKRYSTETAELVCDVSDRAHSDDTKDARYDDTQLYRSPKGQFFWAGKSAPLGQWGKSTGVGQSAAGSGLDLLTEEFAKALVERHADAATYIRLFGEPEEG